MLIVLNINYRRANEMGLLSLFLIGKLDRVVKNQHFHLVMIIVLFRTFKTISYFLKTLFNLIKTLAEVFLDTSRLFHTRLRLLRILLDI